MSYAIWLVPVGLAMGVVGLLAFLWSMKSGQLEDLDGAAERVLLTDAADRPLPPEDAEWHHMLHTPAGTVDSMGTLQGTEKGTNRGAHR